MKNPSSLAHGISVKNLFLDFPDRRSKGTVGRRHVISGLNLELGAGEFLCIVGESGCGKSSFLDVLAGLNLSYKGQVSVGGKPLVAPDSSRLLVFQESAAFPWLTVKENLLFFAHEAAKTGNGSISEVEEVLEMVGLAGSGHLYPPVLSGGMRQRLEIARNVIQRPNVLLLDEPFSALDFIVKLKIRDELLSIWGGSRMTMVFVTHDISEAIYLGDKVLLLRKNQEFSPEDLFRVDLPRKREYGHPQFMSLQKSIMERMTCSSELNQDRAEKRAA